MFHPLKERAEDIPALVQSFFERISLKGQKSITTISFEAMEMLQSYSWPGNVRELQNTMEYALCLSMSWQGLKTRTPSTQNRVFTEDRCRHDISGIFRCATFGWSQGLPDR